MSAASRTCAYMPYTCAYMACRDRGLGLGVTYHTICTPLKIKLNWDPTGIRHMQAQVLLFRIYVLQKLVQKKRNRHPERRKTINNFKQL